METSFHYTLSLCYLVTETPLLAHSSRHPATPQLSHLNSPFFLPNFLLRHYQHFIHLSNVDVGLMGGWMDECGIIGQMAGWM